jgi:transposase
MPKSSPFSITVTPQERAVLEAAARKYTLPYRDVVRAKIILLSADGLPVEQIALRLNTRREVVWKWRKRFLAERVAGLEERSRRGRPPVFPP